MLRQSSGGHFKASTMSLMSDKKAGASVLSSGEPILKRNTRVMIQKKEVYLKKILIL
jgi:hypothetical protein